MTTGRLRLTLVEANLTRDTEMFSKMDPYCKISYREQQFRSKTLNGAGKKPKWNETFEIQVKYIGDDLELTVFDEDLTSSDTVGSAQIKISSLCINGGLNEWFDIQYLGKKSG